MCTTEANLKSRITELEADLQLTAMKEVSVSPNKPANQVKSLQNKK